MPAARRTARRTACRTSRRSSPGRAQSQTGPPDRTPDSSAPIVKQVKYPNQSERNNDREKSFSVLLSVIFGLALLLAACQPTVDEAKAAFCEDLGEFGVALAQYRQINETSTKGELQQAQSDVERAWGNLQNSAQALGNVQTDNIENAVNELEKSVNDIPDDAALAEAELTVKQNVLATYGAVVEISTTTCSYGQSQ